MIVYCKMYTKKCKVIRKEKYEERKRREIASSRLMGHAVVAV